MGSTGAGQIRARARRVVLLLLAVALVTMVVPLASPAGAAEGQDPNICTTWWDGGAGTSSWHDPGNWDQDSLPGPDDVACIEARMAGAAGVTYTEAVSTTVYALHTDTWLSIHGGELRLTQASVASGLQVTGGRLAIETSLAGVAVHQDGGTIAGTGVLRIDGELTWTAGTQEGPGRTDVVRRSDGTGGVYLTGMGTRSLVARGLEAVAGVSWKDGGLVAMDANSYVHLGSSVITAPSAQFQGPGRVFADGELQINGALLVIDGPFDTAATASVQLSGDRAQLALYGGGDQQGDITMAATNELSMQGGTYVVRAGGSIVGAGSVFLSASAAATDLTVQGIYQVAATDVSSGAVLHVGQGHTLGATEINAGVLDVYGTVTAASVVQDAGELRGPGTLDVTGDYAWGPGTMTGPGRTEVHGALLALGVGAAREIADRWVRATSIDLAENGTLAFTGADPQLGTTGDLIADEVQFALTGATGQINAAHLWVTTGANLTIEPKLNVARGQTVVVADEGSLLDLAGAADIRGEVRNEGGSVHLGGQAAFTRESSIVTTLDGTLGVRDTAHVAVGGAASVGWLINAGDITVTHDVSATAVDNDGTLTVVDPAVVQVTGTGGFHQNPASAATILSGVNSGLAVESRDVSIGAGLLSGEGTVTGDVQNVAGTLQTDAQLVVDGSYEQGPGATFAVGVDGAAHGLLTVTGDATIDGTARIEIYGAAPTDSFHILEAQAVNGVFSQEVGATGCAQLFYGGDVVDAVPQPCAVVGVGAAREDAGTITFPVTLSEPSANDVEVLYVPTADSAVPGEDVDGGQGSVVIPAGQTQGTITIGLVDDDMVEGTETFGLELVAIGGVLAGNVVVGTITDDDRPPVEIPDLTLRGIPMSIDVGGVQTINDHFIGGYHGEVIGEDWWGWVYNISTGSSGYISDTRWINDINRLDHALVECWDQNACFRQDKVNHHVPSLPGGRAWPIALNDSDVLVGGVYLDSQQAAVWASPTSTPTLLDVLPGPESTAVGINTAGTIVGTTTTDISTANRPKRGWVLDPVFGLEEIPMPAGFTSLEPAAINDDGLVVGRMTKDGGSEPHAFLWDGLDTIDLGEGGASDINTKGDIVGWRGDGWGVIWIDQVQLRLQDIAGQPGWVLGPARGISDSGAIAVEGSGPNGLGAIALTPPGQGCKVCLDFKTEVQQFPNPDVWIGAGNATTEGNPVRMRAGLTNNDGRERRVSITFTVDGQPYGADEHVVTIAPGDTVDVQEIWDTTGMAFDDGLAAGPHVLGAVLAYEDGVPMKRTTIDMQVNPRPVVLVHGMNSDASTWASYQSFLTAAHPGWKGFAIASMDTSSSPPFTVAKNATKLAAFVDTVQRGQNAWQVDIVAHSMGGLISRFYISDLMQDRGGVRPVDRLVMLGTPNGGSPCADLFTTPVTFQLRTDVVAIFNQFHSDHRGVPFSVAAGDWMPNTCQSLERGDLVVPIWSALLGVEDTAQYDIVHTAMTGSHELFLQFVLPRLNGTLPPGGAPLAPLAADPSFAAGDPGAASLADPAGGTPQLLVTFTDPLAPGATSSAPFGVPAGVTSMGAVAFAGGDVELQLVRRDGTVAATTGTEAGTGPIYRSVAVENPAAESWQARIVNHGTTAVSVPVAVWADGLANRLDARAEQVDPTGTVRITGTLSGDLPRIPGRLEAQLTPTDGTEVLYATLYDDGAHGDGLAGDLVYGAELVAPSPVGYGVTVTTNDATFARSTTTSVQVSFGVDDPTKNDAPTAYPSSVATPRNEVGSFDLTATDPEGSALTYEIVQHPQHGQLGGGGGGPHFQYAPAKDYLGEDSFTFRVHDGELYSAPVSVTITVGKERSQLRYIRPIPAEATKGRTTIVDFQLLDARFVGIESAPLEVHFGGTTYSTTTGLNGFTGIELETNVEVGTHDLEVVFPGDAVHAPTTMVMPFKVTAGSTPFPAIEGPILGEAGYPVNILARGNDADGDSFRFEFDLDDDGTFDRVVERPPASNGVDYGVTIQHTYPDAFDGQVRVRITDAAGNAAEVTDVVHIAPHRPLGALQRVEAEGRSLRGNEISADGRKVLHEVVDHTIDGAPTPLAVLDRDTGVDELVSVLPDGALWEYPGASAMSGTGRYVAFNAGDALIGSRRPYETYLRDRDSDTTTLVSLSTSGQKANWHTIPLEVSDDGRYVLFLSSADNMGWPVLNCGTIGPDGPITYEPCHELYVRDVVAGTTTLVSHDAAGNATPVQSWTDDMTSDGRFVVWSDHHTVHLWDATTGAVTTLGVGIGGADSNGHDIAASDLQLSEDGRYVLFTTTGTNLDPDDTDTYLDIFRFDRTTGVSTLVSRASDGADGDRDSHQARMSGDGRLVTFRSDATNLVPGDTNGAWDVFLRDLGTGTTTRISEEARDHLQANDDSSDPVLSCDGRWLLFASDATNLVPGDVNLRRDVFAFDTGQTRPCSGSTPPPANRAPVAADVAAATAEDTAADVTLTATDADGDALTYAVETGPVHGTLSGAGATLAYTPAADFNGTDTFTFTASDGTLTSAPATVTLTVSPVDDAPVVTITGPASVVEGAAALLHADASDVDGDAIVLSWSTDAGAVTGDGVDATVTGLDGPTDAHVVVTATSVGLAAAAVATVHVENAPPTADAGADVTVPWGVPVTLTGAVTDAGPVDTSTGLTTGWDLGDGTTAVGASTTHAYAAPGAYPATLTATDRDGASATDTATVTVTKRPVQLALATPNGTFGFASIAATALDGTTNGPLAGRVVTFTIDGTIRTATTDAGGVARVSGKDLPAGTHQVTASVDEDPRYLGATQAAPITVGNSVGTVFGLALDAGGLGLFWVQSDGVHLTGALGWLSRYGITGTCTFTGVGISPNRKAAWLSARTWDGRELVVYVEDNGGLFAGRDVFRLWIDGVERTKGPTRLKGDIYIR